MQATVLFFRFLNWLLFFAHFVTLTVCVSSWNFQQYWKKSALGDFQSSKVVFIRNKHFNIDESGFCFHKLVPLPTMNCFCPLAKCNIYHLNSVCRFCLLLFLSLSLLPNLYYLCLNLWFVRHSSITHSTQSAYKAIR